MSKKVMLAPSYMKHFNCIGGECEDTCCAGWNVSIDKKTYLKYRGCKNKEFKNKLDQSVKRNRKNGGDSSYAKIILDANSRCPFLNQENLCDVYINMGEGALSTVCTTYPRIYNIVDGVLEKSLTLSCPEAARIVLDNEDLMSFDEIEYENELSYEQMVIRTDSKKMNNFLEKYFWNLRVAAINIIQNRNYSLDDRMIILGLLCNEVNNTIKNGDGESIPEIIDKYNQRIEKYLYKEYIDKIPSKINLKLLLLSKMEEVKLDNKKFLQLVEKGLKGIGYSDNIKLEVLEKSYIKAYEKYKNEFEGKHTYILENYLVNNIFKNSFPLTNRNDVFYEYIMLSIYYSIVRFNLIGLLSYNEKLEKENIIEFIQVFSKTIEHDMTYIKTIKNALKEQNLDNIACMSILMKN